MKSKSVLWGLLLTGLFFMSCDQQEQTDDDGTNEEMVEAPEFIISVQEADSLYLNYRGNRADFLGEFVNEQNPSLEKPYVPTRFVTVDFDEMYQYMKFVKQISDSADIKPQGLRFYLGQIKGETAEGIDPGVETIFFNPTANFNGVEGDVSYAIQRNRDGSLSAVTVGSVLDRPRDIQQNKQKGANLIFTQDDIQSLAGDEVHFPPPPIPDDPNDYH